MELASMYFRINTVIKYFKGFLESMFKYHKSMFKYKKKILKFIDV